MTTWLGLATASIGSLAALAGLYLLELTAGAAAYRERTYTRPPASTLAVLVPAHNEERLIARCVASIRSQSYPPHLFRVVVVADNCEDQTAVVAEAEGAEVLVRTDPVARGKGQALRWAIDMISSSHSRPQGFVFIDADSVAEPGLLAALDAELRSGADAAQADYQVLAPSQDPLRSAALVLYNSVRSLGRQALGLPAQLLGNGMMVSLATLERMPWQAFSPVEDLEYSLKLSMAGFRLSFAPNGRVLGPLPPTRAAATTQRIRWEGGRLFVLRRHWRGLAGALVKRPGPASADLLLSLLVPPIAVLALAVALGGLTSAGLAAVRLIPAWAVVPWGLAAVALAGHVFWGLRVAHAPAALYAALLRAPFFVAWKLTVYVRLALGAFDAGRWDRTARAGELEAEER